MAIKPGELLNPCVTIGVFDGIHKGHQELMLHTIDMAGRFGGESVVITFREHPLKTLKKASPPLIMPLDRRLDILEQMGISACAIIEFSQDIAGISATEFVEKHLMRRIGMRGIVMGENFRFGQGGSGTPALLAELGERHNFEVEIVSSLRWAEQEIVSSSNIRRSVAKGDMTSAREMLGRPFLLIGTVVTGHKRGRTLGFPTANLRLEHDLVPPSGVYSGGIIVAGKLHPALISIGNCPTFGDNLAVQVEVYIIEFSGDLYGQRLEVAVLEKMRDQIAFSDIASLCRQMEDDRSRILSRFERYKKFFQPG